MNLSVAYRPSGPGSASPYRVLDERGQEIAWANSFLDAQHIRQLSVRSLRAYAYDLLHFPLVPPTAVAPLAEITESTLLRICPSPTRPTTQAHAPNRESSLGGGALLIIASTMGMRSPPASHTPAYLHRPIPLG